MFWLESIAYDLELSSGGEAPKDKDQPSLAEFARTLKKGKK